MPPSSAEAPTHPNPATLLPFKRIMAANRGEIAVRIFRAATELDLESVSLYGIEDRHSAHRWDSDYSYLLPESGTPVGAYLNITNIIDIAKKAKVEAIHPGYGFLSESAEFAKACADADITFVGPSVSNLETFGDKIKARQLAIDAGVSVVPGTDRAITSPDDAVAFVEEYGLPVMIKAAKGGGGKGMRVVRRAEDVVPFFKAASSEALAAFGDGACFVERYVGAAKHVEVQVIGDGKGNVVHLWERDCSVQRRHQKIVEIAPAWHHPMEVRQAVLDDALKLTKACNYKNAGTVEFLIDEEGRHYFMEVNPRVQVEHTVTEQVTNIDIVQTTFLIAGGASFEQLGLKQEAIVPRGIAMQCRITTEDAARDFAPDTGMLDVCRHSVGPGLRVDGYAYAGQVVTPHYDSLLVKYTAHNGHWDGVIRRMRRALRENHIRGVKTNIPFLLNVLDHPDFIEGEFDLNFIENNPQLLDVSNVPHYSNEPFENSHNQKLDGLEGSLKYIAHLAVNGHPKSLGADPTVLDSIDNKDVDEPDVEEIQSILDQKAKADAEVLSAPKWRKILREEGAEAMAKAIRNHDRVLLTDTTWRDAHQSLLATRMRTADILKVGQATNVAFSGASDVFSIENWGGATFDVSMNFLHECPWKRLEQMRKETPDVPFQMLLRGANAVGYTSYPDNVVYAFCKQAFKSGMDIFRVFDSLNYIENMKLGIKAAAAAGGFAEAAICYTGDVTDTSPDNKYNLKYYLDYAAQLVAAGAHGLAVKDMAGLLTPRAATLLVSELRKMFPDVPIHLHTHDTAGMGVASMYAGFEAGADIVDGAIDSMSGLSSQPCLGALVSAFGPKNNNLSLDALQKLNQYWESVRHQYLPFEVSSLSSAVGSNVHRHEIPGGQYTNLLFQSKQLGLSGRFADVKNAYALANELLGDIPKVTPSSKVVGDLAQFLVTTKVTAEEFVEQASTLSIPSSVVEYFQGALGQPPGGFPEPLRTNILKGRSLSNGKTSFEGRPGAELPDYDFEASEHALKEAYGASRIGHKEVLSHALYPKVFKEWMAFEQQYGEIDLLPTHLFFRPLKVGEETLLSMGPGKDYYVRLAAIDDFDEQLGSRAVTLEVNGERWFIRTPDTVTTLPSAGGAEGGAVKRREKADPTSKGSLGAAMPGVLLQSLAKEGDIVEEGQTLFTLSAMKMETEVKAPIAGTIKRILVDCGDSVEADDLMAEIE
mmetsp:Transcript_17/g.30  ORF Transcript_17/g.30 Transcript_17/m.30 type:complete len:1213 (+) Transcript_17:326-3964(+)